MKHNDILEYMWARYPDVSRNLTSGSVYCMIRAYGDQMGLHIDPDIFFYVLSRKSDKELSEVRNLGRRKLQFLRQAYRDYVAENGEPEFSRFKTRFNAIIDDWVRVKNHCRTTDNKVFTEKEPTKEFKTKLLISEHSPIRLIEIDWSWEDIYSWVATHWSRHKFEKFISTQRDDRKEHDIPRGKMPQDAPVKFDGYANMQSLIDSFRKRLCYQASPETRELAEDFKMALHEKKPELADVLVPNCIYRCGCPEFKTCGYFNKFVDDVRETFYEEEFRDVNSLCAITDIQTRYNLYNNMFIDRK